MTANVKFQHTAARRRLKSFRFVFGFDMCFNTQPPEGGCAIRDNFQTALRVSTHSRPKAAGSMVGVSGIEKRFNTQPPEGGCKRHRYPFRSFTVSTHSRPKAAVFTPPLQAGERWVSTHSRPKAADFRHGEIIVFGRVSTHSRPKAAGTKRRQPRRERLFQHTAARRRLALNVSRQTA